MNKNKRTRYAKILLGCLAGSYFQMFGAVMPVFAQVAPEPFTVDAEVAAGVLTYESTYTPELEDGVVADESVVWARDCDLENVDFDIVDYEDICKEVLVTEDDGITYVADVDGNYYAFVSSKVEGSDDAYFAYDFVEYEEPVVVTSEITVNVTADGNGSLISNATPTDGIDGDDLAYTWYKDCVVLDDTPIDFENCVELPNQGKQFTPEHNVNTVEYFSRVRLLDEQNIYYPVEGYGSYEVKFPVLDKLQFTPLTYNAGERFDFTYNADALTSVVNATFEGGALLIDGALENNVWSIESGVLETAGNYNLNVIVTSEDGFSDSADFNVVVKSSSAVAANSTLSVTKNGVIADYVEVNSGYLDIVFEAHDAFGNRINIEKLSRVDVRLNGELLEGIDEKGEDLYRVKRTALVPSVENLSSNVTVDVFSSECKGILGDKTNYCFSKVHNFAIYDTNVKSVENLVYVKRTNASTVRVSGNKLAGYGIKLNSESSAFIVEPNDSTVFSFEVPLAEGSNLASVYAIKSISADLEFYSKPVKITVVKDTMVSPIEWNEPAILLEGENQATLRWTDPSDYDFSHVNIYRSTVPNFVPSANNLIVQTQNPDWTDTNLDSGSNYYYAIEAVDDLGNTSLISSVVATGAILGESATIVATADDIYEYQYVGKGTGGQDVIIESEDTEDFTTEETESNGVGGSEEEDSGESFGAKLKQFFNNAKDSASTVFSSVTGNIFVQICVGGILIFVGLMFLISILVWLKEKIVDARLVSLDNDEKEDK